MTFDEFVARRDAERELAARGRVTWRKVAIETGGGWSGIGSAGPGLVVRVKRSDERIARPGGAAYRYALWLLRDGRSDLRSTRHVYGGGLANAKRIGEEMLNTQIERDAKAAASLSSDSAATPEEGT